MRKRCEIPRNDCRDWRWELNLEAPASRLTCLCYILSRLRKVVDQDILLKVFLGVFPILLTYGVVFWRISSLAERTFLLQKWAIKIIAWPIVDLYLGHCKILILSPVFILETSSIIKNQHHAFMINSSIHEYWTRNRDKLQHVSLLSRQQGYE